MITNSAKFVNSVFKNTYKSDKIVRKILRSLKKIKIFKNPLKLFALFLSLC